MDTTLLAPAVYLGLNLADALLTRKILERGGVEMNPVMRYAIQKGGTAAMLAVKAAAAAVIGFVYFNLAPAHQAALGLLVTLPYAFVVGHNAAVWRHMKT